MSSFQFQPPLQCFLVCYDAESIDDVDEELDDVIVINYDNDAIRADNMPQPQMMTPKDYGKSPPKARK